MTAAVVYCLPWFVAVVGFAAYVCRVTAVAERAHERRQR